MPHDLARSVDHYNLPSHEKSAIQRFYDRISGKASHAYAAVGSKLGMARHSVTEGAQSIRKGGEALVVGGLLGAVDAQLGKSDPTKSGLDLNVPVGAGYNLPIDGAVGVAGFVASMVPAMGKVAEDLQTVGIVGVASWSQRQVKAWVQGKNAAGALPASAAAPGAHGEFGGDPVLEWAARQS